jgi:hypothetical protein
MHRRETAKTVVDPLQGELGRHGIARRLRCEPNGSVLKALMLECSDELVGDLGETDVIVCDGVGSQRCAEHECTEAR